MKNFELNFSKSYKRDRDWFLNYTQENHIELLKKLELSQLNEPQEQQKLLTYSCFLNYQLDWAARYEYLNLQKELLADKLDIYSFTEIVHEKSLLYGEMVYELKSNLLFLTLREKSFEFSFLIFQILDLSYSYEPSETENEYFRKRIKEISIQIQELLKEDKTSRKYSFSYSQLKDQLIWENKDQLIQLIEQSFKKSTDFLNFEQLQSKYQSISHVAKTFELNSVFLQLDYQAVGFSNYIEAIIKLFRLYQTNPDFEFKVFNYWLQKIFEEMKNHYS